MTTYQIIDGHDNAGSLVDVSVQPRSTPMSYPEQQHTPDGTYPDGPLTQAWEYDTLTEAEFDALLTEFGLALGTHFNDVTIKTRENDGTFANYNARIIYPGSLARKWFYRDVSFGLIYLEAL
jgi:hypothetical protein